MCFFVLKVKKSVSYEILLLWKGFLLANPALEGMNYP